MTTDWCSISSRVAEEKGVRRGQGGPDEGNKNPKIPRKIKKSTRPSPTFDATTRLIVRLRGRRDALRRLVHGPGPARREIEADREKEVSPARVRSNIEVYRWHKKECGVRCNGCSAMDG
jgi:hypothetical protein